MWMSRSVEYVCGAGRPAPAGDGGEPADCGRDGTEGSLIVAVYRALESTPVTFDARTPDAAAAAAIAAACCTVCPKIPPKGATRKGSFTTAETVSPGPIVNS